MLTTELRRNLIEKIKAVPDDLEKAIGGLTDEQLDTPYRDGGWTVRQVVHHIAEGHMNAFVRFKLTLTEDEPFLKAYDQEKWVALPDIKAAPITSSLEIIRGLQNRIAILFSTAGNEAWGRKANHEEQGEITLDNLLEIYGVHGENHIRQILNLRSAKGW